ncbi:MAG: haloacid dehalogenase type II [Gaiellaceae bacterium]
MTPRFVVFDVMGTLFDLASVRARLRELGAPDAALEAWFGRLLHSATSVTLTGEFRPFREIAETTLRTTLAQLELDDGGAPEVLAALGELAPYPDAEGAFERLERAGVGAATLTNGGEEHTRRLLERAGLLERVAAVITVDEVKAYKPARAPYLHAAERLGAEPRQLTLIAAHGWDVIGARAAGLGAIWIDRLERRWPFPLPDAPRAPDLARAVELALAG